jgi:hypothetical protein
VGGIGEVLRLGGMAVGEVPYVRDMIENCEFDTIYHEHLCYYSVTALHSLFARHGLAIASAERIPIHGGSLRVTVVKGGGDRALPILEEEEAWGVRRLETYRRFADRVERLRDELSSLLCDLHARGARIAAYGASAKGTTLLNSARIGSDVLMYVVDRSLYKQGRLTPGTHLPIVSPGVLAHDRPDYLLLLSWNHAPEILRQESDYRSRGGRFIIPVPTPRIV